MSALFPEDSVTKAEVPCREPALAAAPPPTSALQRSDSAAGLAHVAQVAAPFASAVSAALTRKSTLELEDRDLV